MVKKVELLAPAGSFDSLVAAVENGADAVYLGGKMFNARQSANNFDYEKLEEALKYCHLRGVKVYVTVNILIKNEEFKEALDYIYKLQVLGVDAIIVQDIGLLSAVKRLFPSLNVHGSTQMAIHNLSGANFLYENGVKRVVLARETELSDIKHISKHSDIELEVFVHGALCISYSGQCLISSMIGGRSGNRGRCAQPCRQKYKLTDLEGKKLFKDSEIGEYLLSPKDLCTIHYLPELIESGVQSFKFEGRMKRPEYVATVIKIYKKALERYYSNPKNFQVHEDEEKELAQIFNRGFTKGPLLGAEGIEMMSFDKPNNRGIYLGNIKEVFKNGIASIKIENDLKVGDGVEFWAAKGDRKGSIIEKINLDKKDVKIASANSYVFIKVPQGIKRGDLVYKTHDEKLLNKAQSSYLKPLNRKILLDIKVTAEVGKPLYITFTDTEKNAVIVKTNILAEKAKNRPLTLKTLEEQLGRLGNTCFEIKTLDFKSEEPVMVPISELNKARRSATEKLEKKILGKYEKKNFSKQLYEVERDKLFLDTYNFNKEKEIKILVHVGDYDSFKEALSTEADTIYLMSEPFKSKSLTKKEMEKAIYESQKREKELIFSLPRFWFLKEEKVFYETLEFIVEHKPSGVLVGNLGTLYEVREFAPELPLYGDYWLNIFNKFAIQELIKYGLKRVTLSPELTLEEIKGIGSPISYECIVHGSIPLMTSRYCALGAVLGGKNSKGSCKASCSNVSAALKDRLNFIFPIETDTNCRMYLFNSKEISLLKNIDKLVSAGIKNFRLELQREPSKNIRKLINMYWEVLNDQKNLSKYATTIKKLYPKGITKGHYFRGVE